jgi:hypothetical protein
MPVLMTKNANCPLKRMNDYQKILAQLVQVMEAERDSHATWTAAVKAASQLFKGCKLPLDQLMAARSSAFRDLEVNLRLLKTVVTNVDLRAPRTYQSEHGEGGAKQGGANVLSRAFKSEKDKTAEKNRVTMCAQLIDLHEKQKRELQTLDINKTVAGENSVAKWVGVVP